ncbi:MAG TPA: hypothetical protein VKZ74_05940 [Natronosporangium sp.]|nr:hypothetical protein [Natronosporangium sp.]
MSETSSLPSFVEWSSFPFEGVLRVKKPDEPVAVEPPRIGEDAADCPKCHTPDDAYIWVNEHWRVRSMDRPSGLPMVLILESRSHLDLGDLPNMLAAELGVMIVRLERAIRSIDGVARVHVNRWGDGAAHLHLWFMARPYGRLQLRGTFLSLWDEILPPVPEHQWQENLALVAAWLAEFGGEPLAKPPRFDWKTPVSFSQTVDLPETNLADATDSPAGGPPADSPPAGSAATGNPATGSPTAGGPHVGSAPVASPPADSPGGESPPVTGLGASGGGPRFTGGAPDTPAGGAPAAGSRFRRPAAADKA